MKKLFLTLVALMPLLAMAQVKFTSMSFADAQAAAKKAGKELLVDVTRGTKEDPNVAKVFKDKELSKFINKNFLAVRIDMSNAENREFGEYLYSLMYPCVVFYTNRGEQLESTNWYSIANGKASIKDLAQKSLESAAIKKANTRAINFRNLDYKQALEAAKKEGKLVFIDNYTTWCRPCKQMEMDVFTLNSVADFYNENFVCIKLDADKDPYKVAKNNGVRGYPAYLYFDADGGLVLNEGGFTPEKGFIGYGEKALNEFNDNKMITLLTLPLDEIKAKAKSEGKMIMIDLSATWCGPCKAMKKNIFTIPSVARFFNKNFVTLFVECDIEKDKAAELKKLYNYSGFPTFLFLNAQGELIHKMVGSTDTGASFIAHAQKSIDNKGLKSYIDRYAAGEKTPEFIKEYISVLAVAYERDRASKVAVEYLSNLSADQMATKENFDILKKNIDNMDSSPAKIFLSNIDKFFANVDKNEVEMYKNLLWYVKGRSFVTKDDQPTFDKKGYKTFISQLKKSDLNKETKTRVENESNLSNAEAMGDWKTYISLITPSMKNGSAYPMAAYNWALRVEQKCKDEALRAKFKVVLTNYAALLKKNDTDANSMNAMNAKAIDSVIEKF